MKLKLFGWALFELTCIFTLYLALFQENEVAKMFIQIAISIALFATLSLFLLLNTSQPPRPKGRGLQQPSPFMVSPNQLKRLAWVTSNGEWLDKTTC